MKTILYASFLPRIARDRLIAGCIILLPLAALRAATLYVDVSNPSPVAPYSGWATAAKAIQTAVDAASSGDTILIAPGTYRITTTIMIQAPKTLTLRGTQGRDAVIDAQGLCRAVYSQGPNCVIEGLTIINGLSPSYGGGVEISNQGTIRDCLVRNNQACLYENAIAENCTIRDNSATYIGGGLIIYLGTTAEARDCSISNNIAANMGGGVYIQYSGTLAACRISDNHVTDSNGCGGGVFMTSQGTLDVGSLVNTLVSHNQAPDEGGGIYGGGSFGALAPIINCTVVDNLAGTRGGGVYADYVHLVNSIIYYNAAPTSPNLHVSPQPGTFDSCCLTPSNPAWPCFTDEPQFVNRAAWDYHLASGSPCIDRGTATAAPDGDLDGNFRPLAGSSGAAARHDVGAYEYVYKVSWDTGFTSIGDGWRRLGWFGDYVPMGSDGWIWHNKHGFFFVAADATPQNIWLYAQDMGWLWTANTTYPFLYRNSDGVWLWYNGAINPRWFRNMTTGQWENRP